MAIGVTEHGVEKTSRGPLGALVTSFARGGLFSPANRKELSLRDRPIGLNENTKDQWSPSEGLLPES